MILKRQQKTKDPNTRNSTSTDGCNFFFQFVFYGISIILNEIFSQSFFPMEEQNCF